MSTWDMLTLCARRKEGVAEDWELCMAECLPHVGPTVVYHVLLSIPRILTRGPRRGRKRFDGPTVEQWMSVAELDATIARYEAETGNCSDCMGWGRTVVSASLDRTTWRDCARCKGTGKAVAP